MEHVNPDGTPMQWCLGFVLSTDLKKVLLAHKSSALYAEMWNGIGGRVAPNETPSAAMVRKCQEQTGQIFPLDAWRSVGKLRGSNTNRWEVRVYATCQTLTSIVDWGPEAMMVMTPDEAKTWPLAPHTMDFIRQSIRSFKPNDLPEQLIIYTDGIWFDESGHKEE